MRARPLFSADSIGKSFGSRRILKAASVWAHEGRITVIFGRNGCGKTTLLRIAAGLLPADHGVVHFAGRSYLHPRLPELAARGLFFLPDRGLLAKRFTLRAQIRAIEWRFGAARTAEILDRLALQPLLDRLPSELSGGERRRAEMAAAWIRAPRCLLADEPFAGIAPLDADLLADAFRDMARNGCAIVLTGHDARRLLDTADAIVWVTAGTTHGLGTPADAMRHEQFRREYLGGALAWSPHSRRR